MNPLKYQPLKLNTAQKLLVALGLDDLRLFMHQGGKRESFTKKGPGRRQIQGNGKRQHAGTFADSLMRVWAEKRLEAMRKKWAAL